MRSMSSGSVRTIAASSSLAVLLAVAGVVGVDCVGSSGGTSDLDGAAPAVDSGAPDSSTHPSDAGADGSTDATLSTDSGRSNDGAAADASPRDASADAAVEAGTDSGLPDTGADSAPVDGGVDSAPLDAGEDTGSSAVDAGDASLCNGVCVVLAANQDTPFGIATDGVNVYWTNDNGSGTVLSLPVDAIDGAVPVTLASGQSYPYGIALDSTAVYWANYHADVIGGTIMKALLDGGAVTPIATGQTGATYLTIQGGIVYWSDENVIESATTAGVAGPTISSPGATYIASGASGLYWAGEGTDLTTAPLGGTTFSNILTAQFPEGIAVDTTAVYFANSANNATTGTASVMKVPFDGGSPTVLASGSKIGQPLGVAIDGANIYWTDLLNGTVMKVGLNGGAPVVLASGQASPWNIAVDSTSVYWTDEGNCPMPGCAGTVMKLTPK